MMMKQIWQRPRTTTDNNNAGFDRHFLKQLLSDAVVFLFLASFCVHRLHNVAYHSKNMSVDDDGNLHMTRRSGRNSIGSDFGGGSGHMAKRSRQGSISGRLRTASDLEDMGWITSSQKGLFKDLIISDDPVLRNALDKYESGNVQELKGFIRRGSLSTRRQSIDLLDTLDLDFLNVKFPTTDMSTMINSNDNGMSYDPSLGFGTFDDFFPFPEDVTHTRSATRRTNSLLGTFDGNIDFDGTSHLFTLLPYAL